MEIETPGSSRIPGFFDLKTRERLKIASAAANLSSEEADALFQFTALPENLAENFIENAVGTFSLPLGIATNFKINGCDILIPMAVEESSVIAAASFGAKLARTGGGFFTKSSEPIMTGQVQIYLEDFSHIDERLNANKTKLIDLANAMIPSLILRGGGVKDLSWYLIKEIRSLVVNLHVHTGDAMGANIVNTLCETLAPSLLGLFPRSQLGLRILTNLCDRRLSQATCSIPASAFDGKLMDGGDAIKRIAAAWEFAYFDIYRAATHNKGIMNGVDSVVIATGNDWRAVEAGAHAYCCREGRYRPMSHWWVADGHLHGSLELPMAVGIVGGVTKLHPAAKASLKLLGSPDAKKLGEIICSVGLAQNLSAIRALATEGIQKGHMALHQKNFDLAQSEGGPAHLC